MAVLGNLRKNSFVLISVIGMALFAFVIAGVFDGAGNQSQDPVGKINGEKIQLIDYKESVEFFKKSYNYSDQQAIDFAWDQMIRNKSLLQQADKIGIQSSFDHLKDYLSKNPNFNSDQRFINNAGVFEYSMFVDFILELKDINPESYLFWKNQEEKFNETIRINNYFNLVLSGINSNYHEAKKSYESSNDLANITYAKIPYSSIPDSIVKIDKSDVIKYAEENIDDYSQESTRNIKYVVFNELPSVNDKKELRSTLNNLLSEKMEYNSVSKLNEKVPGFLTTDDFDSFLNEYSDVSFDTLYRPKGYYSSEHAQMIFNLNNGQTYGPYFDGDFLKYSKMLDKKLDGNARASHILISFKNAEGASSQITRSKEDARKEARRVLRLVKSNPSNFSTYALELSDGPSKSNGGDLGFFQQDMMVKPFSDFVFNNSVDKIGLVETIFGFHIIKITSKEDVVKVATLGLKNVASERTSDSIFNITSKLEIDISETLNIDESAKKFNYDVQLANDIKELDHDIPNLKSQRSLVQWLFNDDTSVGDYRKFNLSNGGYVIAQITEINDDGLIGYDQLKSSILPILINERKAKIIIEKNKNFTTIEELSKQNNIDLIDVAALNQKNPVISQAGFEPKVLGNVFSLDENANSGLIEGSSGVFMIKLNSLKKADEPNSLKSIENNLKFDFRKSFDFNIISSLKKSADISDNRTSYF